MVRPMLKRFEKQNGSQESLLKNDTNSIQKQSADQMDKLSLDRILRKPRSKDYMNAMQNLDAGGHSHNQEKIDEILEAIRNEFPEIALGGILIGTISICYLGEPYEVHVFDPMGGILEHYTRGKPLPDGLEKARSIALCGSYEFIEVYTDCCRAISANGTVSVIRG